VLGREMIFKEDGCRLGGLKNKTKGLKTTETRSIFDGLPGVLHQRESVNSNVLLCDLRVTYIKSNLVCDAFMNRHRNAVTQLYRVIQEERSIFCDVSVSVIVNKKIQVKCVSDSGC
jgi:hypothetical protein